MRAAGKTGFYGSLHVAKNLNVARMDITWPVFPGWSQKQTRKPHGEGMSKDSEVALIRQFQKAKANLAKAQADVAGLKKKLHAALLGAAAPVAAARKAKPAAPKAKRRRGRPKAKRKPAPKARVVARPKAKRKPGKKAALLKLFSSGGNLSVQQVKTALAGRFNVQNIGIDLSKLKKAGELRSVSRGVYAKATGAPKPVKPARKLRKARKPARSVKAKKAVRRNVATSASGKPASAAPAAPES